MASAHLKSRNKTIEFMRKYILLLLGLLQCTYGHTQMGNPQLIIEPTISLYHQPIVIQINGLPAHQKVKLLLKAKDVREHQWYAEAYYISNQNGVVDLATMPSVGGHYLGIRPMGLFWSMKSEDYHQLSTNKGFEAKLEVVINGRKIAEQTVVRKSTRELEALNINYLEKRDSIIANFYNPKS